MSLKISVIVPCYNGEPFLERCLQSVTSQDYKNIEIFFVDNESTDNSLKIAEKFKEINIGTAKNIYPYSWSEPVEEALTKITGDYFTIIAADDVISENYISNVVKVIENSEEDIQCMQSPILRVHPDGQGMMTVWKPLKDSKEWKEELLKHCPVNTPAMVYKKELYDNNHMTYDTEGYLGASDYDLYCQFIDKGIKIHNHTDFLGYHYRVHQSQATWGMVEEARKGNRFDAKIQSYWRDKWNL